MSRIIIAVLLMISITACNKDHKGLPPIKEPTTMELLTSGLWLLTAFGFDDDSTGKIEDYENMMSECHKDNTALYKTNGTGNIFESELRCGSDSTSSFEWKWIDNNKAIEVLGLRMDIHKLNKNELYFIVHQPFLTTPLHSIYKKLL